MGRHPLLRSFLTWWMVYSYLCTFFQAKDLSWYLYLIVLFNFVSSNECSSRFCWILTCVCTMPRLFCPRLPPPSTFPVKQTVPRRWPLMSFCPLFVALFSHSVVNCFLVFVLCVVCWLHAFVLSGFISRTRRLIEYMFSRCSAKVNSSFIYCCFPRLRTCLHMLPLAEFSFCFVCTNKAKII